jgi:hypothetical protein
MRIVWSYIRRNPIFRTGDIVAVTGYKKETINTYLRAFCAGGYIKLERDSKQVGERIYRLVKNVVEAPSRNDGIARERKAGKMKKAKRTTFESAPYMVKGLKANYSESIVKVGKYGTIFMGDKRIDRVDLERDGK